MDPWCYGQSLLLKDIRKVTIIHYRETVIWWPSLGDHGICSKDYAGARTSPILLGTDYHEHPGMDLGVNSSDDNQDELWAVLSRDLEAQRTPVTTRLIPAPEPLPIPVLSWNLNWINYWRLRSVLLHVLWKCRPRSHAGQRSGQKLFFFWGGGGISPWVSSAYTFPSSSTVWACAIALA